MSRQNNVAGHRADLAIRRAARALAAYEGRREITDLDIGRTARWSWRTGGGTPCLPRRRRNKKRRRSRNKPAAGRKPEEETPAPDDPGEAYEMPAPPTDLSPEGDSKEGPPEAGNRDILEHIFEIGQTFKVRRIEQARDKTVRRGSGRRSLTRPLKNRAVMSKAP